MKVEMISTAVLIVGAGPTGLTLANVLGCAGVDTVLIDRKASTVGEPRAVSIDDESLRTMQSIGLAEAVLRDVVAGYGVHYYTRPSGRCFGKVEPTVSDYGYPRRNAFRQPLFEATLRAGLDRFASVRVLFGHTLSSFIDGKEGVRARIVRDDGSVLEINARYMVGSDGGRSPVRELLGVPMTGSTFASRWLVIDTERDDDPFWQTRVYCDATRPIVDVPGPHKTRRYEILIHPHEDAQIAQSDEAVSAFLRPLRGDRPLHLVRKVVYTFHARMAERWRVGNVFLAGDAAHLTPPYAGQGMNSGVRDAHNLGWKLAAVINEEISNSALNSYESERRGHAWALIRLALNLGVVMAPRTRVHAAFFHTFFTFCCYVPPLRDYFLQMKFKPKPRFDQGLLGPADAPTGGESWRGRMLPQPRVRDALGEPVLLDDAIGNGFALIAFGRSGEQALRELSNPLWARLNVSRLAVFAPGEQAPVVQCDIRAVIDDGGTLSAVSDGKIILVRPDRYIAGTFAASAETRFADSLGATLGCPPTDERANLTVPAGKGPHIPDIWRNDEHITSAKPDATASSVH